MVQTSAVKRLMATPIESVTDLHLALEQHQPGDVVDVTYQRDRQPKRAKLTLRSDAP